VTAVTRGALRDSAVSLLSPTQDHINDLRHRGGAEIVKREVRRIEWFCASSQNRSGERRSRRCGSYLEDTELPLFCEGTPEPLSICHY
jgi:hypothetical protein